MPEAIHPSWFRDDLHTLTAPPFATLFTPPEDATIAAAFLWHRGRTTGDRTIRRLRAMLVECGEEWAAHEGPEEIIARTLARRTRHDYWAIKRRWKEIRGQYLPPTPW